uniref:Uncharacterized protein n=1 Tax=Globisporangium ultimum (strain ATCC 200006 / CBS 805.95 / DAOM BR144) TaxID=431595 RepID=K3WYN6_GLOUD
MAVAATLTRIFRRSKRKELFDAVRHGDVDTAEALIKQGIPVHIRDRHGRTLMSYAAENGNVYIVLLLRGAGASFEESGENSLVGYALVNGHLVTAKALIELGAAVNGVGKYGK